MTKALNNILNQLDLIENKAVFYRNKGNGEVFYGFSSDINKKLDEIKPDAFFVFNKQPLILFFDLTSIKNVDEAENEIHKKVWSFDNSPIIFIIKDSEIKVYNALNFEKHTGLEEIKLSQQERNKKFSFWNLQSGETLEWFYEKHKKTILKKRVNQQLFENIKQTIILLKEDFGLEESLAKILVLRLIFVRYLIDRKIKIDTTFIQGNEKSVIARRKSLSDLIANPKQLAAFFDYLNTRFNGVLFKDSNIELTFNQADKLSKIFNPDGVNNDDKLTLFSDFDFQYDVFDFGIIPVELISGIYETLLDEETKNTTSAVYTPPFLVDYILNETVDAYFEENTLTSECKIFDPAMGSGIFLVQGLRRMIEREKKLNPNDDNLTFGNKIKEIAERNLFGIDINEEAINVACFSIYVALLDYQEPGNIDQYIFPNLKDKNFFKAHFFDSNKKNVWDKIKKERVNFILGNPPWKSDNSPEHLDWLKQTKFNKIVSDKQLAQSYLIRVKDFVQKESKIALIVTSKVYFNNKAQRFKKYFLENNKIYEIFDLSAVRRLVFENADNPGTIITFKINNNQKEENLQSVIKHISLKQNRFFNKFSKNLIIEKFDIKEIQQKYFLENIWMFKVALYGNTLDYLFIKKLYNYQDSFKSYLEKVKDIHLGDGIKKHTKGSINKILSLSNYTADKYPKPFYEISKIPIIETKEIKQYVVNPRETNLPNKQDLLVKSGRKIDLYLGDRILFSSNLLAETEIVVPYVKGDSVFREKTLGVATTNKKDVLKKIYAICLSDLYTYFQYLNSSNWGVYYSQILQTEYLSFPYFQMSEKLENELILITETILKFSENNSVKNNFAFEKNCVNNIINLAYGIKDYEKDLIDYALNVSRYQFQESKQHLVSNFNDSDHRNKKNVLKKYAEVYIQEFKEIYEDCFFKVEIYELDTFITMHFVVYDEKPLNFVQIEFVKEVTDEQELFEKLSTLSISKIASSTNEENNLFIQKDIKGFEESSFYIIKPKEYKCWHRAMAWYDVAEFKEAIQRAELERINLSDINE
ncbi:DNA methyltransferase [Polaribacter cellanae]|uniref:site-specific DNA-methyltransferase (adenine-specific) n=1 Tax=Polaribacter cellanae TaxID=2818493 RepID=A0A975H913_9FLAO|nr:DNA methyltransferase [Polaribacter cellanae]QTE22290.1 hypothetical protein J3359_16010 [Polaribacter cellanae]